MHKSKKVYAVLKGKKGMGDENKWHGLVGGLSGSVGITIGHPLDTLKVNMQAHVRPNQGVLQASVRFVRERGVLDLFRGLLPPIVGDFAINFFLFTIFHKSANFLSPESNGEIRSVPLHKIALSGMMAGSAISPWVSMYELLKVQLQVGPHAGQTKNLFSLLGACFRDGLIKQLGRGWSMTCGRDSFSYCAYFSTYEGLKRTFGDEDGTVSAFAGFLIGGLSGQACWLVSYPMDVLKTRVQSVPLSKPHPPISTIARDIVCLEGPRALYKGLSLTLLRAFPVNAAILGSYDLMMKLVNAPE